ncbi:hypothetical protein EVAR_72541_1 [Eumeta japonica]|uniref:Uncharacterized protein n=1 Tax=Eumeta variegata TaxID=151549 RepID=A0A4C1TGF9_EUMVA|nr:hypothetical protein EVAR_72541_1 [Eumeta japonica]
MIEENIANRFITNYFRLQRSVSKLANALMALDVMLLILKQIPRLILVPLSSSILILVPAVASALHPVLNFGTANGSHSPSPSPPPAHAASLNKANQKSDGEQESCARSLYARSK